MQGSLYLGIDGIEAGSSVRGGSDCAQFSLLVVYYSVLYCQLYASLIGSTFGATRTRQLEAGLLLLWGRAQRRAFNALIVRL